MSRDPKEGSNLQPKPVILNLVPNFLFLNLLEIYFELVSLLEGEGASKPVKDVQPMFDPCTYFPNSSFQAFISMSSGIEISLSMSIQQ